MMSLKVFNYRITLDCNMIEIQDIKRNRFKLYSIGGLLERFFYGKEIIQDDPVSNGKVEFITMHERYFKCVETTRTTWWSKWSFIKTRKVGWMVYLEQPDAPVFDPIYWTPTDTSAEAVLRVLQMNKIVSALGKWALRLESERRGEPGSYMYEHAGKKLDTLTLTSVTSYSINKRREQNK